MVVSPPWLHFSRDCLRLIRGQGRYPGLVLASPHVVERDLRLLENMLWYYRGTSVPLSWRCGSHEAKVLLECYKEAIQGVTFDDVCDVSF